MRKVKERRPGLKMNGTYRAPVYAGTLFHRAENMHRLITESRTGLQLIC